MTNAPSVLKFDAQLERFPAFESSMPLQSGIQYDMGFGDQDLTRPLLGCLATRLITIFSPYLFLRHLVILNIAVLPILAEYNKSGNGSFPKIGHCRSWKF